MAGFGELHQALEAVGASVVAASADPIDKATEVAGELSFPVAYGVTREMAGELDAWWEERRGIIQPAEFIVGSDGKVVASTYSSGPLGRMHAPEVVKLLGFYEAQSRK